MRSRIKLFCFVQTLSVVITQRSWSDAKDPGKEINGGTIADRVKLVYEDKRQLLINKAKEFSDLSLTKVKDDVVAEFHDFPVLLTANEIGEGFLIGLCCGYFVKKTTKVFTFVVGGVILGMEGLRASGVTLPDLTDKKEAFEQFLKDKNIDVTLPTDCLSATKEVPTLSSVIKNSDRNIRKDMGILSGAVVALLYF